MLYRGVIRDGKVEFTDNVKLPEGTPVRVERTANAPKTSTRATTKTRRKLRTSVKQDTLAQIAAMAWDWGVSDTAAEHDHYASGAPRRTPNRKARSTRNRRK